MDLIIQPEEVGTLARPISQHIDREQLVAYITEVEQLQIRSSLGGVLYSNIKQSPSSFDIILNGGIDEVGEVSGGIRKAMAYYVYARIIREGGTIATRFGAVEKTDEYATQIEQERKNTIYRQCNNIADVYMVEVVNYAKAQGWMDEQGANSTRNMAYVVGGEEAGVNAYTRKSRQTVNAELVAGDGINIVDGEISVDMGAVQEGTGMTALAKSVENAETNIEEVRRLATQREEVTVGNGLIKDKNGSIAVDFEVVASNAEIINIRTNANDAKTEAGQAKKLAEDAISALCAINEIASDARTTAQSAKTEADSAVTTAIDAVRVAGDALGKADQATTVANDALLKANSAQTSAESADAKAEDVVRDVTKVANKQLQLSVKDNGNIVLSNANGESKEFMPATPSGDPMHYAYEAVGAVWNDTNKMWVFQHKDFQNVWRGLYDLTNEDMRKVLLSNPSTANIMPNICHWARCILKPRTLVCYIMATSTIDLSSTFFNSDVEYLYFGNQVTIKNAGDAFYNCGKLKVIGTKMSLTGTLYNRTFRSCPLLVHVRISRLIANLEFNESPNLSGDSILYMIEESEAKSPITITLHANAYAIAVADTEITTALASKPNITLASA